MLNLQAYCFICEKKVTVHPWSMNDEQFWDAIRDDKEIEVGHRTDSDGNHLWKLKGHEKQHIRAIEHTLRRSR